MLWGAHKQNALMQRGVKQVQIDCRADGKVGIGLDGSKTVWISATAQETVKAVVQRAVNLQEIRLGGLGKETKRKSA